MMILAIDAAIKTGWAFGPAGSIPQSGSERLIDDDDSFESLPGAAAKFVLGFIRASKIDLIMREAWLEPTAHPSDASVKSQMLVHGGVLSIASIYKIPCASVAVGTWRKHFCGRSRVSAYEKQADPLANKRMVLARAKLLKYVPADCTDFDRADACGIFDFAAAQYGRRALPLHLYGENAA